MFRLILTLPILLAACLKDETISGFVDPSSQFQLVEINGKKVSWDATITFPEEGTVGGKAPCNSFSASQTEPYPWFRLGPVLATRRACANLSEETMFFGLLSEMTAIEVLGNIVILRNDSGEELVFHGNQI